MLRNQIPSFREQLMSFFFLSVIQILTNKIIFHIGQYQNQYRFRISTTGWSIWYCPILNEDCGNFSQISKRVFWVILITNFDTFCYLKSDFWYSKKIFWPKIMIILRVPHMKKKISSSLIWKILPDNKMYQNFHYKSYFQTYQTPRIGPQ